LKAPTDNSLQITLFVHIHSPRGPHDIATYLQREKIYYQHPQAANEQLNIVLGDLSALSQAKSTLWGRSIDLPVASFCRDRAATYQWS
jgi:hypothetical protein